jgi:hypothetical protein
MVFCFFFSFCAVSHEVVLIRWCMGLVWQHAMDRLRVVCELRLCTVIDASFFSLAFCGCAGCGVWFSGVGVVVLLAFQ